MKTSTKTTTVNLTKGDHPKLKNNSIDASDTNDPWVKAWGLHKGKRVDAVKFQKMLRKELSR